MMNQFSNLLPLMSLFLVPLVGCTQGESGVNTVLEGACPNDLSEAVSITGVDDITEMCLITDVEEEVVTWRWSEDGTMFAFAVHEMTITRPVLSGRYGYFRPPATRWYILNLESADMQHFAIADNKRVRFSPDGKYIVVQDHCYYATCTYSIYELQNSLKTCQYKIYTVWLSESDCENLILKNGELWDIGNEINNSGCDYYRKNGWESVVPRCLTDINETSYPIEGVPSQTPAIIMTRPPMGYPAGSEDIFIPSDPYP